MSDDLQPLLLNQPAFLNVELLLSFRINLFSFFIGLLKCQYKVCLAKVCSYDLAVLQLVQIEIQDDSPGPAQ